MMGQFEKISTANCIRLRKAYGAVGREWERRWVIGARGNVRGSRLFATRSSSHGVKRLPSRAPGTRWFVPRIDTKNVEQPQMDADEGLVKSRRLVRFCISA
jgi:hypothetical protein